MKPYLSALMLAMLAGIAVAEAPAKKYYLFKSVSKVSPSDAPVKPVWKALQSNKTSILLSGNTGSSVQDVVVVTNPNTQSVTLLDPAFAGGLVSTTCGNSLAAGASCAITVSTTLSTEGESSSSLQIGYKGDTDASLAIPVAIRGNDPYVENTVLNLNIDVLSQSYSNVAGSSLTPFGPNMATMQGAGSDPLSPVYSVNSGLRANQSSNWVLGGEFTVEAWIYPTVVSDAQIVGMHQSGWACNWMLFTTGIGELSFHWGNSTRFSSAPGTIKPNKWQKVIASKKADGVLRLFVDGVKVREAYIGPDGPPGHNMSNILTVGNDLSGVMGMVGAIDNVKITKGVGRY